MLSSFRSSLARSPNYRYWAFAAISVGTLGSVIDSGSVNVALPTIADHFNTIIPTIQWVVIAYTLTITALLLPMGRLADLIGSKQVYVAGGVVFVLGAVLAGFSTNLYVLFGARVFQGVGAAMTQGTSMVIVISSFQASDRGKAIGLLMTVIGAGAVAGPAIGGLLVDTFGWPSVFFFNIPLGVIGIIAAWVVVRDTGPSGSGGREGAKFDWLGAVLSTGALITLLLAMTNGHRSGWASPPILIAVAGFGAFLGSFIWWELKSPNPMLDLRLFKIKSFSLGISASFFNFVGSFSVIFLMPFYLQGVLGFSAGQAGLIAMPGALCIVVMSPISGVLSDRLGWRWFTVGGLVCSSTGLFLLSRLTEDSTLAAVFPALILTAAGMATFYSPNTSSILSAMDLGRYGIVSALLNLVRNGANIISLAMATAIITATMGSMGFEPSLGAVRETTDVDLIHAFSVGLRYAFLTMMSFVLVAMAISAVKVETAREISVMTPTGAGQSTD